MTKLLAGGAAIVVFGAGLFLFFSPKEIVIQGSVAGDPIATGAYLLSVPESATPTSTPIPEPKPVENPPAGKLQNPPDIVKGIYVTSWVAGSSNRMKALLNLIDATDLNAVVIDIKDYSGFVAYRTGVPGIKAAGAENDLRIASPNDLLRSLHAKGIYVIGRISVFQDPVLAQAHPEWAITASSTGGLWRDRKGLAWMDPAAKPVWDYNAAIARDAFARGFDEINFDYIRFPSDGNLDDTRYPFWDETTPMKDIIKKFFSYLRETFSHDKISADLFGLATIDQGDLGIGQVIESAYETFDYISPMVYPSHYAAGSFGYKNPADHPYEVIKQSLTRAAERYGALKLRQGTSSVSLAKLRPWLQAFDLGAVYDTAKIEAQVRAVSDVLTATSSPSGLYAGWLFWDPNNRYASYPKP